MGLLILRGHRRTQPIFVPANATWVVPNKPLPNFTAYNSNNDLVEITAGSEMDRPWNPSGSTIPVNNANDLQPAINAAAASSNPSIISVDPSVTVTGFNLPVRPGPNVGDIYIMSAADASLPSATYQNNGRLTGGTTHRARPANAAHMWKIRTPVGLNSMNVTGAPNVCHYVISGFDCAPNHSAFHHTLVSLAPLNPGRSSLANYPTYITLDRFYIHNNGGWGTNGIRTAIWFEVGYGKVRNGWVQDITDSAGESKCLLTVCNPGPWSYQNCFLSSSGENFFIGGSDPEVPGHVPGHFFFDGLHLYKNPAWCPRHPLFDSTYSTVTVKNNGEYKYGDTVCGQRFICEENWNDEQKGGQVGVAFVPKTTNQNGGTAGNHVYGRNWTWRHFAIYNSNGGFGLTGLTQRPFYIDEQVSRPQELDLHSGVIALGARNIYGHPNGARNYHAQLVIQELNKNFRIKRISGASADEPYCAVQFTGPDPPTDANDGMTLEDCTLQYGLFFGQTRRAYQGDGPTLPSPFDGDAVINHHTNGSTWQRIGLYGGVALPTNPLVHDPNNLATSVLHPEHVVVSGTTPQQVYANYNSAAPWDSDWTITHPSFATLGEHGTVCGADWSHLGPLLAGVRN